MLVVTTVTTARLEEAEPGKSAEASLSSTAAKVRNSNSSGLLAECRMSLDEGILRGGMKGNFFLFLFFFVEIKWLTFTDSS